MSRCERCGGKDHTTEQHERRQQLAEIVAELLDEGFSADEIRELFDELLEQAT